MRYLVPKRSVNLGFMDDFDRFFTNFWDLQPASEKKATKSPSVDVRENPEEYVLEAELPGFGEGSVDVSVDNHVLHISSQKEEEQSEEKKEYILKERASYSFDRSFVLPENVNEDEIKGTFKNGILTLVIPKNEEKKPKRIDIKIAS